MPKKSNGNFDDIIQFPDIMELWKKNYFKTEEALTNAGKEFVSSKVFVDMLDNMRDQYLSYHKVSTQYMDQYFENNPVPSKKDIARVAELVIALEDKIDNLDIQLTDNVNSIAKSLIKLADFHQELKDEVLLLRKDFFALSTVSDSRKVLIRNPGEENKGERLDSDD